MKVKVGDKVRVLAGADKGKEGKILLTLKAKDRVVVEGVNIVKKHQKPTRTNETGGILEIEAPIHVSNVKVLESSKSVVKKAEVKVEKKTTKTTKSTKTTKKSTKKEEVGETNE